MILFYFQCKCHDVLIDFNVLQNRVQTTNVKSIKKKKQVNAISN